jgi:hypothetical protein
VFNHDHLCAVSAFDRHFLQLFFYTTLLLLLQHTLPTMVQGGSPCTAKVFPPRLGVVQGSFFNTVHRTTLPLANPGSPIWFFKVGIVSLQIGPKLEEEVGGGFFTT